MLAQERESRRGRGHHEGHAHTTRLRGRLHQRGLVVDAHTILPGGVVEEIALSMLALVLLAVQLMQQRLVRVACGELHARLDRAGVEGACGRGGDGRGLGDGGVACGEALTDRVLDGEDAIDELLLAARDLDAVGLADGAKGGKGLAGKLVGAR